MLDSSEPYPGLKRRTRKLSAPGLIGSTRVPAERDSPLLPMTIRCSPTGRHSLEALLDSDDLILSNGTVEAVVELEDAPATHFQSAEETWADITVMLRIPGVYFRSVAASTSSPVALSGASVTVLALPGITGKVTDAIVRVKGAVTGLRVECGESFATFAGAVAANEYVRIDSGTRTAWLTATDTWAGGTDVTGQLDWGPTFYPLIISPSFVDPATRTGELTVITATRTNAAVEVRAKGAYVSADL